MFAPWQLPILFATGLVAGWVDAIAGGGGLITLPVLLSFGSNPALVFGTNKVQATCGSASAAWHYARAGAVPWRDCTRVFFITLLTSALGAITLQLFALERPDLVKKAVPIVLIAVAIYALLRPQLGFEERPSRLPRVAFDFLFGSLLGFYDGFFGPGVGTFWTIAWVTVMGYGLMRATGYAKVVNLASNFGALALFVSRGNVDYVGGLVMGAGQLIGARMGSKMVIRGGAKFIRPIFISVVIAVALKLSYDAYVHG
jgi:uncharacterized membrane protein YfcA